MSMKNGKGDQEKGKKGRKEETLTEGLQLKTQGTPKASLKFFMGNGFDRKRHAYLSRRAAREPNSGERTPKP
jgi:hypothetical protein